MGSGGIVRRPAVPSPVRIRRDINNLPANDPIITFYEKAIREMQRGNVLDNPLSWRYQAAIHGYYEGPLANPTTPADVANRRGDPFNPDPFANINDKFPPDRDTFWRKCEHGRWFFLSWHRMYIHFFEKIIAEQVVRLNGPTNWALPYWNYSSSEAAARLPAPFRSPTISDPSEPGGVRRNFLFVAQRNSRANAGLPFLDVDRFGNPDPNKQDTNLECLRATPFEGTPAPPPIGFGGPAGKNHPGGVPGSSGGALEQTPHNSVHSGIGGFMGIFSTAALDPIFWLHHCNIDRLWEVWVQRQKHLGNLDRNPREKKGPNDDGWLSEKFDFHDAAGNPISITSKEVLNTKLPPLSYEYEDTSDPFNGAP